MDTNKAARKAYKAENRHSRKETRLHVRAVAAAAHGRLGKAAALEARANKQHRLADDAHNRAVTAQVVGAAIAASHNNPNKSIVVHTVPQPQATVTVVHQYEPTISYPTGSAVPPPDVPPPAESLYPPYVFPGSQYSAPPAGSYPAPGPATHPPPAYSTYP